MAFNTGDIVKLKSGGPKMTVDVPKTMLGTVSCVWFDGMKRIEGDFQEAALELWKEPAAGSMRLSRA